MSDTRYVDKLYYQLVDFIDEHYTPIDYSTWRALQKGFTHSVAKANAFFEVDDADGELPFFSESDACNVIKNDLSDKGGVQAAKPSQPQKLPKIEHKTIYDDPRADPRTDEDMDAMYYDRLKHNTTTQAQNSPLPARFNPTLGHIELDESFSESIIRLIQEREMTDPECYYKANLSRAVFNKIKQSALSPNHPSYQPSKQTALALALALELSLDETKTLLEKAGLSLSHSNKGDIIVEYFLINKMYNIDLLNEMLYRFDQPLLGSFT